MKWQWLTLRNLHIMEQLPVCRKTRITCCEMQKRCNFQMLMHKQRSKANLEVVKICWRYKKAHLVWRCMNWSKLHHCRKQEETLEMPCFFKKNKFWELCRRWIKDGTESSCLNTDLHMYDGQWQACNLESLSNLLHKITTLTQNRMLRTH